MENATQKCRSALLRARKQRQPPRDCPSFRGESLKHCDQLMAKEVGWGGEIRRRCTNHYSLDGRGPNCSESLTPLCRVEPMRTAVIAELGCIAYFAGAFCTEHCPSHLYLEEVYGIFVAKDGGGTGCSESSGSGAEAAEPFSGLDSSLSSALNTTRYGKIIAYRSKLSLEFSCNCSS